MCVQIMASETTTTQDMSAKEETVAPEWGMIVNTKENVYYTGYAVDKKPHGFGVLLNGTHLAQGLWVGGQLIAGFMYDLREQKFGFVIHDPKENENTPEGSASPET